MTDENHAKAFEALESSERSFKYFSNRILSLLTDNPALEYNGMQCVHTLKHRQKSRNSILGKCNRKFKKGTDIDENNVFDEIEDYHGIRLLHLHLDQVPTIHNFLASCAERGEFSFGEHPKAYTWDPEFRDKLINLGLQVEFKESFYTSIHYILRNGENSPVRCELQVRTLFEETWGELDHWMNYPEKTENLALREQLMVLSRVVTAASRLAVSIHRIHTED